MLVILVVYVAIPICICLQCSQGSTENQCQFTEWIPCLQIAITITIGYKTNYPSMQYPVILALNRITHTHEHPQQKIQVCIVQPG